MLKLTEVTDDKKNTLPIKTFPEEVGGKSVIVFL